MVGSRMADWRGAPVGTREGACAPQFQLTFIYAISMYHATIIPENESGSKCTVHLTRFFIKKSKWTLPPILALLAGDLWCFTFAKKRGVLEMFHFCAKIYFRGGFARRTRRTRRLGKRVFRRLPGRQGRLWHRMPGSRGRSPHHREEITMREGSPGVSPHLPLAK